MSEPLVVVVGGANIDVKARSTHRAVASTSNPGTVVRTPGGVGRNVAENLARLGTRVALVSAVGDDADGDWLLGETAVAGVDVAACVRTREHGTGTYAAVLDADGELVVAVADMAAVDALTPEHLDPELLGSAALVVLDGNLSQSTLAAALELAGGRVVIEPVSVPKAQRLSGLLRPDRPVYAVTPNRDELRALGGTAALLGCGVELVWTRRGRDGSRLTTADRATDIEAAQAEVVDVTGAGDAMLAAFCHHLLRGADPEEAARQGHRAAALTIASPHTVRPDLQERMQP